MSLLKTFGHGTLLYTIHIGLKCIISCSLNISYRFKMPKKKPKPRLCPWLMGNHQMSELFRSYGLWSQGEWGFQRNEYFIDMMWIRNPIRYYSMLWSKIAQPEEFIKLLRSYLYWTFRPSWYNRHDMQYMYWKVLSYQLEFEWRMRWILQQDESL